MEAKEEAREEKQRFQRYLDSAKTTADPPFAEEAETDGGDEKTPRGATRRPSGKETHSDKVKGTGEKDRTADPSLDFTRCRATSYTSF